MGGIRVRLFNLTNLYNKLSKEEKEELSALRHSRNYNNCKKISYVLLTFICLLLTIDFTIYRSLLIKSTGYKYLLYLHVLYLLSLFVYYAMIFLNEHFQLKFLSNISYFYLVTSTLLWCLLLSINGQLIHSQISAYIIAILAIASFVIFTSLESLIMIISSLLIFILGMYILNDDPVQITTYIVNGSISVVLAFFIARTNYSIFIEEFINKKEILKKNCRLEKHDKMKSILMANISHELKTPLNLIYSAEQMLNIYLGKELGDISLKTKSSRYLKIIKQNSYRLMRLINNIVDSTKMDMGEYKIDIGNYDIIAIINNIVDSVTTYIESAGINISINSSINKKTIACDPDAIERILLNLISNAVKYTPKEGNIVINIYSNEGDFVISVNDTGVGVPLEVQDSIFKRYVQADDQITKRGGGSGIGLSLVSYLVEMHSGTIDLISSPGEGSEFIVKIPDRLVDGKPKENEERNLDNDQVIEKIQLEFSDLYSGFTN